MPPGASASRGEQKSALAGVLYDKVGGVTRRGTMGDDKVRGRAHNTLGHCYIKSVAVL